MNERPATTEEIEEARRDGEKYERLAINNFSTALDIIESVTNNMFTEFHIAERARLFLRAVQKQWNEER